jgi:hypothetical protein
MSELRPSLHSTTLYWAELHCTELICRVVYWPAALQWPEAHITLARALRNQGDLRGSLCAYAAAETAAAETAATRAPAPLPEPLSAALSAAAEVAAHPPHPQQSKTSSVEVVVGKFRDVHQPRCLSVTT